MKILHVITSLRTGGAEKLMVDLLPRMKAEGLEIDLCVFDGVRTPFYEEMEKRGVKVIALGSKVYSIANVLKLTRLMRDYDVVHSHNTACQFGVAWGSMFSKAKIVTTEHNTTNRRRSRMWKMLDRWMYGRYDKIVCISELTMSNLLSHIGEGYRDKCALVDNGIDLSVYGHEGGDKDYACEEGEERDKKVVMVSAFRAQKDQKTLIRAMKLLPDDYALRLVGGGDDTLINECKELAADLHLQDRVIFMGVRTDIPEILQDADVVVLSSHYEGLSLSSVEGMASGRPFVASDVEGLSDIVGEYGVLFPHGDSRALASAIKRLCEDEKYRDVVVGRCMERAKMFDIKKMADKYMKIYYAI